MISAIKKLFSNGTQRPAHQLARNDDCWCGSGKKYKRCHIDKDRTRDRIKADACRTSS
ncbi:MAG: SEC-C metal-binding domain-containing protein [bacterium]|nr:SEC-C metal-binding domain-containing protein [bacterium]MDT8365965.1 SEC-C metal-binding domain-containing protein [bacterium]